MSASLPQPRGVARWGLPIALLAGAVAFGLAGAASVLAQPCVDADHDGLGDTLEQHLAETHAPVILLEPNESNYPCSVEWYLERAGLAFHEDCFPDEEEVLLGTVGAQAALIGPPWAHPDHFGPEHPERHCGDWPHHRRITTIEPDPEGEGETGFTDQMTFYLTSVADADRVGALDPRLWPTYFHAYPTADGGVMLQYWHVFTYNQFAGVFGSHDGDWDANLMVQLGPDLELVGAWYPRHTDEHPGPFFPLGSFPLYQGTHPVMSIDGGGHAAFATPEDWCAYNTGGSHMGTVVFGDPDDPAGLRKVDGCFVFPIPSDPVGGTVWKTWTSGDVRQVGEVEHAIGPNPSPHGGLINVGEYNPCTEATCRGMAQATSFLAGEFHPLNGQEFIRYSGRWGKTDITLKEPRGPVFQGPHDGVFTAWYNQGAQVPPYPLLLLGPGDDPHRGLSGETYDGHGGPLAAGALDYLVCGDAVVPQDSELSVQAGASIGFLAGATFRASGLASVDGAGAAVRLAAAADGTRGAVVWSRLQLRNGGGIRLP